LIEAHYKREESQMAGNRSQIMIADDHAFVADACRKLLEPEFDVVATVEDGCALVRIAANSKPQVVFTDIGMPHLNGLDAGCQVKQIDAQSLAEDRVVIGDQNARAGRVRVEGFHAPITYVCQTRLWHQRSLPHSSSRRDKDHKRL
jgi:CheY-like chemotaxis protein